VWGLQCHPEARPDIVTGWAAKDRALAVADDETADDERTAHEVADVDLALAAVADARAQLADAWRPLATGFAERVRVYAGAAAR
jgi:hypothetical protein